jgi:hypothetical protein
MSTTKLAEAARAVIDRWDSPAWKDAPHTGEYIHALRQALASYEAEPAVQVVVERERVLIKRGVQSFALAYEAETDAEREWYAGQLRAALSGFVKTEAEAKPAPANLAQTIRGITEGYRGTDCGKCAESIGDRLIDVLAAPVAPAPEPLTDEQIDQVIGNSACWDGPGLGARFKKEAFARLVEQAHGIGIPASKETK